NFLKGIEKELNIYLAENGTEKINNVFKSYKQKLLDELASYLQVYIKSRDTRGKILEEIKKILENTDITKYKFAYTLPDVSKYFREVGGSISKMDIIVANFTSKRFLAFIFTGIALVVASLVISAPLLVKEIIALLGLVIVVAGFIDSAYFNKYYLRKFVKDVRGKIREDVEKSIDLIIPAVKSKIVKTLSTTENTIVSLIKRETKFVKEFENYLVSLRNRIEKHIFNISNIKKDLEYELSESGD
ncbi:MAG: hypothetical protein GXO45_00505, partial [Aquificae bacterium]|nr:hypothetical protein [Aquificota bacterium]